MVGLRILGRDRMDSPCFPGSEPLASHPSPNHLGTWGSKIQTKGTANFMTCLNMLGIDH